MENPNDPIYPTTFRLVAHCLNPLRAPTRNARDFHIVTLLQKCLTTLTLKFVRHVLLTTPATTVTGSIYIYIYTYTHICVCVCARARARVCTPWFNIIKLRSPHSRCLFMILITTVDILCNKSAISMVLLCAV